MPRLLIGHECCAGQQQGWGGIKNGRLLQLSEGEFDLFITSDQNVRYQQDLAGHRIAILELSTNKLRRIEAVAVLIQTALGAIKPGEFRPLEIP